MLAVILLVASNTPALGEVFFPRGDSHRFVIWQQAIERIGDNWVWGLGILTDDNQMIGNIEILHSHSLYLSLVHQSGAIGLVLFSLVLIQAFSVLLRNYANDDAKLSLSMLAMALSAYVLDGHELVDKVGSSWFLIWFPVGIAVGLQWSRANSEPRHELFGMNEK